MAFTATRAKSSVAGSERVWIGDVSITSYTTGGETITPATFGLGTIDTIIAEDSPSGHRVAYDRTNGKLKVFVAAGTEVPNATNLSTSQLRMRVSGDNPGA